MTASPEPTWARAQCVRANELSARHGMIASPEPTWARAHRVRANELSARPMRVEDAWETR